MKKKIASIILSLSLVFNVTSVGVFAEGTVVDTVVEDTTVVAENNSDNTSGDVVVIDEDDKITVTGKVYFDNQTTNEDELEKLAPKIVFTLVDKDKDKDDDDNKFEADLEVVFNSTDTTFEIKLPEGEYIVTLDSKYYDFTYYSGENDVKKLTIPVTSNNDTSFEAKRNDKVIDDNDDKDESEKDDVWVTGIVTFPNAEFKEEDFGEDTTITFTPKKGDAITTPLSYKGDSTATYGVYLLEETDYTITISGINGYTLSGEYTTKDEDSNKDMTAVSGISIPSFDKDENSYGGDNKPSKVEVNGLENGVTATIEPIETALNKEITDVVFNREDTSNKTTSGKKETTTTEYTAPLFMFDFSVGEKYNGDELTITIEFATPIVLEDKRDADFTFLTLFHFNAENEADIVEKAEFNEVNGEVVSVTFTTDDFSPFAIAQGYSTVKITNTGSSGTANSSTSSSSGSVSAVGSDGTKYYVTGNVPTVGFISQLRGVSVGEIVNLDKITIANKEIIGWFYDREFTKKVEKTSVFEITQDIMDNGVYPQFEAEVGVLAAEMFITNTGEIVSSMASITVNEPVRTTVPSTSVVLGAKLF